MSYQRRFTVSCQGRGFTDITAKVAEFVSAASIGCGIANVFTQHTSCSLTITENADFDVRRDLESLALRWAPDGDPAFRHVLEGEDDMSAHGRSVLAGVSLCLPVAQGTLLLGTWQGIFLWEHRTEPLCREVIVTVVGN